MDFAAAQLTRRPQATIVFVDPDILSANSAVTRHLAELPGWPTSTPAASS